MYFFVSAASIMLGMILIFFTKNQKITKEDGDSDLTIEEIDLIGSHLDKEIEDLNHSIQSEDCTQIRKQTRNTKINIVSNAIDT